MKIKSVFYGDTTIIPLHIVQHLQRHWYQSQKDNRTVDNYMGLVVITSKTVWDFENDDWANSIYLPREEADKFLVQLESYWDSIDN